MARCLALKLIAVAATEGQTKFEVAWKLDANGVQAEILLAASLCLVIANKMLTGVRVGNSTSTGKLRQSNGPRRLGKVACWGSLRNMLHLAYNNAYKP